MSKKQTSLESFFAKGKGPEETCAQSTDSTATRNQLQTDQNHVKAESKHRWIKRRPNFTGAEVEVLLQDVDVSILFHYVYIHAIEFSAYLFIHCHLQ